MAMFGSSARRSAQYDAAGIPPASVGDRLLNLLPMSLIGVDVLGQKRRQALFDKQNAFMSDLGSKLQPQYESATPDVSFPLPDGEAPTYTPPVKTRDALNINSPDLPSLALKAQQLGVPLTQFLDVLKAQQPDVRFDRGYGYNGKSGAPMGGYHPDLDKGIQPGANGGAEVVPGYTDAAASIEGAKTGAQEKAKAPYSFPTFTGPDGRPVTVSAATAAALGARGGIISQGPSPAQTAADTTRAQAGAAADVSLPQTLSNASQALQLIQQLKTSPALGARTGLTAIIPAIPGSKGADFDAMAAQLKGKVFLEAFGSLKGAGQITEVEGKKATDAIARLNQTQSEAGYLKALSDLEDVIRAGAARAQQQPGRLQPAANGAPSPARPRAALSSIPVADRLAEARRRGLIP
jgi:hypothetical protein